MAAGQVSPEARAVLADAVTLVAHELEHGVAEVRDVTTTLTHLVGGGRNDPVAATCNRLVVAVGRLERSLDHLLHRPEEVDELRIEPVRVASVVRQVVAHHRPHGHDVRVHLSPVVAHLDPVKFERIVDNLIRNAVQHTPAGSTVTVRLMERPDGAVRLTVTDEGPGQPRDEVSELLATAPAAAAWSGLGVVARFVQMHGGTVVVGPGRNGSGLRVRVDLPGTDPSLS